MEADRPTHIFLRKLYSLIECGKVYLVPMNDTAATTPKNYIGYEDDNYYYLMLDVSHKAVKKLCGEQDEGFAISAKSLAKALADEGLIEVKNGVHNIVGKGKNRYREITIHYRFLGVIEIPTDDNYQPLKVDTRQGVAVEYVPNAASA